MERKGTQGQPRQLAPDVDVFDVLVSDTDEVVVDVNVVLRVVTEEDEIDEVVVDDLVVLVSS